MDTHNIQVFFTIAVVLRKEFKCNFILHIYHTKSTHLFFFLTLSNFMSTNISFHKGFMYFCILFTYIVLLFCTGTPLTLYGDKADNSEIKVCSLIVGCISRHVLHSRN